MAEQVQIIDIAEPMQDIQKKDGSGTYRAMKVTVKLADGGLKTIMSFDEKKVGDIVSVEEKNGYLNIVKPSRGYDKPAGPTVTDVMQAIRMLYQLAQHIDKKVEAVAKEVGVKTVEAPNMTQAVNDAIIGMGQPSGFEQFQAAREQHGIIKDNLPDDDDVNQPIDLAEIPF